MVTAVQGTQGAIAYIAVSYLISRKMPAVAIRNNAGNYVYPNLSNISNAASIVKGVAGNNEIHLVNPPRRAKNAYPLSTFTYAIVRRTDPLGNGAALKAFIKYAIEGGQAFGPRIDFVPLPKLIKNVGENTLKLIH
jgi:phosphate transport system substrate-binding protein